MIQVPLRRIVRPLQPGIREEAFRRETVHASLPRSACALVLVDVWDRHHIASHQERCDAVVRSTISPLLGVARRSGLRVIHAPGSSVATKFGATIPEPNRWVGESSPGAWPPADFRSASGGWDWLGQGPAAAEVERLRGERTIHPEALPIAGEWVVGGGEALFSAFRTSGTLFVFFAGFAANICVLYREYGMRAVRGAGYQVVLLRDATTAVEFSETVDGERCLQSAIDEVEMNLGWTATAMELAGALGGPTVGVSGLV